LFCEYICSHPKDAVDFGLRVRNGFRPRESCGYGHFSPENVVMCHKSKDDDEHSMLLASHRNERSLSAQIKILNLICTLQNDHGVLSL
jgi:hypothetical protein